MRSVATLLYLTLFCWLSTSAQVGNPLIKNYSSKDITAEEDVSSPQTFAITQDDRGVLYMAKSAGVLEYDGSYWRLVEGTPNVDVFSLAKGNDGRIYVGGIQEFGYLAANDKGLLQYRSLVHLVDSADLEFGRIWRIVPTQDGVYFNALKRIFLYQDSTLTTWKADKSVYFPLHTLDNEVYVCHYKEGFKRLNENKEWEMVFPSADVKDQFCYVLLPGAVPGQKYVGTLTAGLFAWDAQGVRPAPTTFDGHLKENFIYNSLVLNDALYAIGTQKGGLVLMNPQLELQQIITEAHGVLDNGVYHIHRDEQDGLWLSSGKGFSRVDALSPISTFSESSGLSGITLSLIRFKGRLYCGTTEGLYYLEPSDPTTPNQFKKISQLGNMVSCLLPWKDRLWASGHEGIFAIDDTTATMMWEENAFWLLSPKQHPDLLIASGDRGLISFRYAPNGLQAAHEMVGAENLTLKHMVEDEHGGLWAYSRTKGVFHVPEMKVDEDSIHYVIYDSSANLPANSFVFPSEMDGKVFFSTDKGIFTYNYNTKTFERPADLYEAIGEHSVDYIMKDKKGVPWVIASEEVGPLVKQANDSLVFDPRIFKRLPKTEYWCLYPEEDGVIWFGTTDGLVRYNSNKEKDVAVDFDALIRKVIIGEDSVIFYGTFTDSTGLSITSQPEGKQPVLDYTQNIIGFEYAAPSFEEESANQFRYFLEGYDKKWSNWTPTTTKQYTNLFEGKYTFRVQARNIYGHQAKEAAYVFTIEPPLYRTTFAYAFYGLLFIGVFWGGIQLNARRLRAANIRLQHKIEIATEEIRHQNAELQDKNEEIAKKNENITKSIRYAERIQQGVLPATTAISDALPDSFIYFRPRDIVSGDFYWFGEKDGKLILAAADCTGHGVPGAFVSMIGNTMLNKVINEMGITDAGSILKQLDQEIKVALKQDDENTQSRDGMDIALCVIDRSAKMLYFAGAYNPLYMIRKDSEATELEQIKADRNPVAGFHLKKERKFTTNPIAYQPGDIFYIFSDGPQDQFGGPENRKYGAKRMRDLFFTIRDLPMSEQYKIFEESMADWMGDHKQMDDMLLIGFRL